MIPQLTILINRILFSSLLQFCYGAKMEEEHVFLP